MFETTEKLRQYLADMGIQPLEVDQEDDGSLSAYLQSRRNLAEAFSHFVDLDLDVTARHRAAEGEDRYHLNVSPQNADLVCVDILIYIS